MASYKNVVADQSSFLSQKTENETNCHIKHNSMNYV